MKKGGPEAIVESVSEHFFSDCSWVFQIGNLTRVTNIDMPKKSFDEYTHTVKQQLRVTAAEQFDGAGMEAGTSNDSYRIAQTT